MRRIILASESPRRRELMAKLDVPFTVKGAQIDETLNKELPLYEAIEDIAYRKAAAVAKISAGVDRFSRYDRLSGRSSDGKTAR